MTTPEIAEARRLAEELANTREELAELRREHDQRGGMLELTRMARDEVADELERLRAQVAPAPLSQYGYGELFAAIADATRIGAGGIGIEVSVAKFREALAAAAAAQAQQADPKRELLERIVDGATPGEGGLTASLRAVAADALAQQAGQDPAVPHGKEQQEKTELPPRYMLAKLQMVMPLFQEARDALTALTEQRRKLRGISPTLADRMDEAGTFSLDDWTAMSGKES